MSVVLGRSEAGNALWLILLGITLLAGLTALVARTGSQSEDTGSAERLSIGVSEILNYGAELRNATAALTARGCAGDEISFENSTVAGYENLNSPADKSCHVFDANGAGVAFKSGPSFMNKSNCGKYYIRTGSGHEMKGFGADNNADVFLLMQYGTSCDTKQLIEACDAIHKRLGIPAWPGGFHGFGAIYNGAMDILAKGVFRDNIESLAVNAKPYKAFCASNFTVGDGDTFALIIPILLR